ncbi:hypothetical protein FKP32DRAFT_1635136 [Trametes sanguinea]|nr:hypothetical protein FKP32DRAFT_1635136 [Trametes sanguinea]
MFALTNPEVRKVLALIEDAELPHPSAALLACFVRDSVDPIAAALYVRDKLSAGEGHLLVSDWSYIVSSITENGLRPPATDAAVCSAIAKRDGGKCCITGKPGTLWDPLVVVPILPYPTGWLTDQDRIMEVLDAFFTSGYREWWLAVARHPDCVSPYYNHWLVLKSAAQTFAQGQVELSRLQSSMIEFEVQPVLIGPGNPIKVQGCYALLGDHSRLGIEKVDARFVGTHARLCRSMQFIEVAKELAPHILPESLRASQERHLQSPIPRPRRCSSFPLMRLLPTRLLLSLWLLIPKRLRIATYDMLLRIGKRMYQPPESVSCIHRLPFGLYLKYRGDPMMCRNAFNAMRLIHQHTSVPVPKPLDLVIKEPGADPDDRPEAYLLTARMPGVPLSSCQAILSDSDLEHIAAQMTDYLAQLRTIPKTVNPDMAICNTFGGGCIDPRLRGWDPKGPFRDEAAFSSVLFFGDDPARRGHKIVFTHADLNPRNILVDRVIESDGRAGWRVTAIVDWDTAGYFPEYWDYTKALFEGFRWTRRYVNVVKRIFSALGDYSKELHIEQESWKLGDGI